MPINPPRVIQETGLTEIGPDLFQVDIKLIHSSVMITIIIIMNIMDCFFLNSMFFPIFYLSNGASH